MMSEIFVAQWFSDTHRDVISGVENVLFSLGARALTGRVLGGKALDDAVNERIERCDGLVALATHREELQSGRWMTHPWVINEFAHAKSKQMDAIALVETNVDWEGPYAAHEHINLDRNGMSDALLELSLAPRGSTPSCQRLR